MGRKRVTLVPGPVYSTHQVAEALGVSRVTVARWFDEGRFGDAARTVGGHRRVTHAALLRFARRASLPLPPTLVNHTEGAGRVLVVDDELDFAEMVAEFLTLKCGLAVAIADSGFVAGQQVERFRPHLILLDLMMPDMNGFDAFRRLRSHPSTKEIPVIACTAYRDPALDQQVSAARFDGFIEKPVDLVRLRSTVARFVTLVG